MVFSGAEVADQGVGIDDAGRFSQADELFNYKGQLLPLHLRARLQIILYEINQQEEAEIMTSSSTILLLLLLLLVFVLVLLVFSKLQRP